VTSFAQSGDLVSVYRAHGRDADALVGAALDLVE
jgi:pyruvate dehydrogenase E1 component